MAKNKSKKKQNSGEFLANHSKISLAEQRRIDSRRIRIQKLDDICKVLGINSSTPLGGRIYESMAKNYGKLTDNEILRNAQNHPELIKAQKEKQSSSSNKSSGSISALSLREQNRRRAADAHKIALQGLSKPKKMTFGITLSNPVIAPTFTTRTVTPRNVTLPKTRAGHVKSIAPLAAVPTGLQPAQQARRVAFSPESIRAAMMKHIPGVHHRDFAVYLHRNATSGKSLAKIVKAFLIEKGLAELVRPEPENTMNHLPQNAKHTLQLIRMPSEEVIDLGHVSYEAWLTHNHYDPTNLVSQRTAWAYSDGWHIKRCVNTITGEEDFWLISFNGRGGEPIGIKSQRDYRSAYRYLAARGYHSTTLEGMDRNTLYKSYKTELGKGTPEQTSKPKVKSKPIRTVPQRTPEQQEERRERANRLRQLRRVAVREGQGRFRLQVLGNYGGACCITGLVDNIEAAHIVPHCDTANQHPANGLPLAKFLHGAFDTGLFSVNPETLRVEVAPAVRTWLSIDGIQIADGQIWPIDRAALAAHHALFKA